MQCTFKSWSFQGVEFKLEIKNLAMTDSKGHDLEKDIVVRVTSVESKQVRIMILWEFKSITDKKLLWFLEMRNT